MSYRNTKDERESDSENSYYSPTKQSNVKRILMLLMISMFMVFAGLQTTPTTTANVGCNLVCGEPFIDPNTGQCVQMCCPEVEECKIPCELRPCKQ
jgi:hypothetical protein